MVVEITPDEGARFIVAALPPLRVALEALLPAVIPADVFQLDFAFLMPLREKTNRVSARKDWMCGEILAYFSAGLASLLVGEFACLWERGWCWCGCLLIVKTRHCSVGV